MTKGLHRFNPAQKDQKSQTEEVMGITSCHFPWLEEAAQLWPFALLTNFVDDVKKLKRAKESKDRKEYVFDIKKEWTGVTA